MMDSSNETKVVSPVKWSDIFGVNDLITPVGVQGIFIAIVCLLTSYLYWKQYSYWSRYNVKSATPFPLFGNLITFMFKPRDEIESEYQKRFGRIFGYHFGLNPFVVVMDADVLRQITIKNFDIFTNRYFVQILNKYQKHFLTTQKDDHWRGMRAIMSPTFASGKIKSMMKNFDESTEVAIDNLKLLIEKERSSKILVDLQETSKVLAISSAFKSFYGIKVDQNDTETSKVLRNFVKLMTLLFRQSMVRIFLIYLIPLPLLKLFSLYFISPSEMDIFYDSAVKIVKQRQEQSGKQEQSKDFVGLLLAATSNSKEETLEADKYENHHVINQPTDQEWTPSKMRLSEEEVYCSVLFFMIVATQTTSELIQNTIYLLANNSEVQDRLYEELTKVAEIVTGEEEQVKFTYEKLTSCDYLDCVISESLRLMPQVYEMDRVASQDFEIGEPYNIKIPKGSIVKLPYFQIHRDPEYWPDPLKFDPDRFSAKNKPNIKDGTYNPFGIGPRFCIGFRFALTEAKVALAKFVMKFKFEPALGVPYPAKTERFPMILMRYEDLKVTYSLR